MTQRSILFFSAILLIFLAGCRSKDAPELYRPGDIPVWRTAQTPQASTTTATRPQQQTTRVSVETNYGSFVVELFDEDAPISVANFLRYVDEGFYNGLIFHRVIPGFMIQGGGFDPEMNLKPPHENIMNEAGNRIRNNRGTLAMARTQDVNSANSQFYINIVDNPFLNGDGMQDGYAVFGRILTGMEVVDRIAQVETGQEGSHSDVPLEPVIILNIERPGR
jgi:cyclophilin family peptidyl-prolyl cis-trans isomerase